MSGPTKEQIRDYFGQALAPVEFGCIPSVGSVSLGAVTRDYAAGRKAGMEKAAMLCENYAKRHAENGDDYCKAQAWMMLQCAAEIRAEMEEPK